MRPVLAAIALRAAAAAACGAGAVERWRTLPDATIARTEVAAAGVGSAAYVVGGEQAAGTIAQVESYAPRRRRWRAEPPLPMARHGLGAVAYRGSVVVLAGRPTPGLSFSDAAEALRVDG